MKAEETFNVNNVSNTLKVLIIFFSAYLLNHTTFVILKKISGGKEFSWKQQYQNHILSVHEGIKPDAPIKDKICPHCPKLFSSNYHLTVHIDHVHEGKDYGKGFCDICSKTVR